MDAWIAASAGSVFVGWGMFFAGYKLGRMTAFGEMQDLALVSEPAPDTFAMPDAGSFKARAPPVEG